MSTSKKTPASVRHGGPGASHENAKKPPEDPVKGQPGHRKNASRSEESDQPNESGTKDKDSRTSG